MTPELAFNIIRMQSGAGSMGLKNTTRKHTELQAAVYSSLFPLVLMCRS